MGQCLKCGKETTHKAVFCGDCMDVMQNYPVKPDTVIHLPQRPTTQEKKPVRYAEPTQAEQMQTMRGIIRWLTGIVAALSVLLVIMAGLLIHTLDQEQPGSSIGKNYTTATGQRQP